jgi:hypothetical protein
LEYSFFAFGFDTTTMFGYSLIVEGTHNNRTVVEQNLQGIGNPGSPQTTKNIELISVSHDASSDLTTLLLERANHTDPNDPDFDPGMTRLDVIWGYSSFASPQSAPDFRTTAAMGALSPHSFHGSSRAQLHRVGHNRRSRIFCDGFAKTGVDLFVTGSCLRIEAAARASRRA